MNKGDVMDCKAIEQSTKPVGLSILALLPGVAGWFYAKLNHPSRLDLEGTPDRVKRDLGFLDGRDPRYEEEFWR
jgi:hypothetical protein